MITRSAAVQAARFLILAFLLSRFPHLSAQTSITGAQIRNPLPPVVALPATCSPYSIFYLTTNNTAYVCTAANTFTPLAPGASGGAGLPSSSGTPGYLFTNGTTVSWGNIQTGGSGALDCASTPGQCDVTSIVPLKGAANTWTGANDFHAALLRFPESTVAGLPPASTNTGREFMVTDGASVCDTTTGGGSTRVLVESNGAAYVAPNCSISSGSSGAATATAQLTDFAPSLSGTTMTVQPGRIRFGTMPCTNFTTPATASVASMSGGTGIAKLYISSTCTLIMVYPSSLTIAWNLTGQLTAQPVATPVVPAGGWYVGDINIGPSAVTAITDKRSVPGMDPLEAGTGIVIDCTLGACLTSTDPAVVPTFGGVNAYTGTEDASAASITKPNRTVTADPSGACANNNEVILSTASGNLFSCLSGTWHATGGGGNTTSSQQATGSQYVTTGNAQVISDGGDYIIATSGNLPALAAGSCWDYEIFFTSNQNAWPVVKLWFGSGQTVGSDYSAGSSLASDVLTGSSSGNNPAVIWLRGQVCNNNGSQSSQTATLFTQFNSGLHSPGGTSGAMAQNAAASNLQIGISVAGANIIKVQSFRVWLTQ